MGGFQLDSVSLKFWFQLWVVLTVQEVHFSLQERNQFYTLNEQKSIFWMFYETIFLNRCFLVVLRTKKWCFVYKEVKKSPFSKLLFKDFFQHSRTQNCFIPFYIDMWITVDYLDRNKWKQTHGLFLKNHENTPLSEIQQCFRIGFRFPRHVFKNMVLFSAFVLRAIEFSQCISWKPRQTIIS